MARARRHAGAGLVAAGLLALIAAFCFRAFRKAGLPSVAAAAVVTLLIALHPALLRAVVAGPADMFLAAFLLMLCLALYDLRARSGTSEVMGVGLALMALAFSHPMGAAFAFAAMPFLAFAVRPVLVANSALNVIIALIFPTLFAIAAFTYVSWVFPGRRLELLRGAGAEPVAVDRGAWRGYSADGLSGVLAIDASLAMARGACHRCAACAGDARARAIGGGRSSFPAQCLSPRRSRQPRSASLSGFFGDPTAIVVAAPVLAATVVIRVPVARERIVLVIALLMLRMVRRIGQPRIGRSDHREPSARRLRTRRRASGSTRSPRAAPPLDATACWPTSTTLRLCARARPRARNSRSAERAVRARDAVRPHRYAIRRRPGSAKHDRRRRSARQGVSLTVPRGPSRVIASYTKTILGACLLA